MILAAWACLLLAGVLLVLAWWRPAIAGDRGGGARPREDALPTPMKRLERLARPMPSVRPSDWRAQHDEPGQSYAAWLNEDPVVASDTRRVLGVVVLGATSAAHERVIDETIRILAAFYQLPVRVHDPCLPMLPAAARRAGPMGNEQWRTGHLLHQVVAPRLIADEVAIIGLTAHDLWPGPGWNFVFGQASLRERVGVWSLARFGDPAASDDAYRRCLRRTVQTATHEVGHMFGMRHCTAWACGMNGANHLAEADGQPLAFCPQCLAKLVRATGCDPVARARELEVVCRRRGLTAAADHYRASAALLSGVPVAALGASSSSRSTP